MPAIPIILLWMGGAAVGGWFISTVGTAVDRIGTGTLKAGAGVGAVMLIAALFFDFGGDE